MALKPIALRLCIATTAIKAKEMYSCPCGIHKDMWGGGRNPPILRLANRWW
jgi:hypothetical protein